MFPTVWMGNGEFGIRATGFNSGTVGGGGGNTSFGDINIQTAGSSGDSQKAANDSTTLAREVHESMSALVRKELINNSHLGGIFT